jgi:hypothetical protein
LKNDRLPHSNVLLVSASANHSIFSSHNGSISKPFKELKIEEAAYLSKTTSTYA